MKTLTQGLVGLAALMCGTAAMAQDDAIQVGIVAVNYNSPSIQVQADTAVAAAEARGWEVELFDGQGDQVATNNAAIAFIDRGFDAIINVASANTQMTPVIAYANEHEVPFVSTFSGLVPGIVADIGSNNTADAAIAAMELVGRIDGQGHVVKLNWNVLPALRERDQGFHAVVDEYPGITLTEIEVKVPGQVDDAYAQMQNLLLSNDDIVAVWVGWDELAAPVARAIEQAGMADQVFVVSQDGVEEAIALIRQGGPIALTVAYDVPGMGVKAVEVTEDALNGIFPASRALTLKPCLITQATAPAEGQAIDFDTCMLFSGEE